MKVYIIQSFSPTQYFSVMTDHVFHKSFATEQEAKDYAILLARSKPFRIIARNSI